MTSWAVGAGDGAGDGGPGLAGGGGCPPGDAAACFDWLPRSAMPTAMMSTVTAAPVASSHVRRSRAAGLTDTPVGGGLRERPGRVAVGQDAGIVGPDRIAGNHLGGGPFGFSRLPGSFRGELRLHGPLGTVPPAQQTGDAVRIGVPAGWRHVHAVRVSSRRLAARPSPKAFYPKRTVVSAPGHASAILGGVTPRIRPGTEPKSISIERTPSRLPGATVLAGSPAGRIVHAPWLTFRRTSAPGLVGCSSTTATIVS